MGLNAFKRNKWASTVNGGTATVTLVRTTETPSGDVVYGAFVQYTLPDGSNKTRFLPGEMLSSTKPLTYRTGLGLSATPVSEVALTVSGEAPIASVEQVHDAQHPLLNGSLRITMQPTSSTASS